MALDLLAPGGMSTKKCIAAVALLAACASPPAPLPLHVETEARQWPRLRLLKAELWEKGYQPAVFEVPDHGQVRIDEWHLEGGPGWEYVRARFTFRNTTPRQLDEVIVTLVLRNHDGSESTVGKVRLVHPWGRALAPGTFYADEVRAPLGGIHWDPEGWSISVGIDSKDASWRLALDEGPPAGR
jgi:hypothetical protein